MRPGVMVGGVMVERPAVMVGWLLGCSKLGQEGRVNTPNERESEKPNERESEKLNERESEKPSGRVPTL
jgi:hypothetical protein